MNRLDCITTNFGFGPVAKLVAVARAVSSLLPSTQLRLLASGHALAFGRMSGAFNECLDVDLDSSPEQARAATEGAGAVIDSLNFDVLPHLTGVGPGVGRRVFLLDSLAWLWPHLPPGIEEVAAYAVQGYLLDSRPQRAAELPDNSLRLRPILDPDIDRLAGAEARAPEFALVSLGGCCNPFVAPGDLLQYAAETVRSALRVLLPRFRRIEVHTNAQLAADLQEMVGDGTVTVRHSSHRQSLRALGRCGLLLTTPGITATLEAIALGTPLKFLPPNNYSQYRILEIYHQRRILSADVRFSAFSCGTEVAADMVEADAVRRIGEALAAIRPGDLEAELTARLEESLDAGWSYDLDRLGRQEFATGNGALDLVEHIASVCELGEPLARPESSAAIPRPQAVSPDVEATVLRLVTETTGAPPSSLSPDTRLAEDLGVDSMGILELVAALQNGFGFTFGSGEVDVTDFKTVGRIVTAVSRRLPGATTAQ